MNKVDNLLKSKLESKKTKAWELAKQSTSGHLSSFSMVFKTTPLTERERKNLIESSFPRKTLQTKIRRDISVIVSIQGKPVFEAGLPFEKITLL